MMDKEQEIREKIKKDFAEYLNRRILIYGSKRNAVRIIETLKSNSLIGVLDGERNSGDVSGIPVLSWKNVQKGDADMMIIASSKRYYREIYERIIEQCQALGIELYDMDGQNLTVDGIFRQDALEKARYCKKNEQELKKLIVQYDAVSFDVFDTLVMRKTLEPIDVFDIVAQRIENYGIRISNFRILRKEAESKAGWGDIYCIYRELKKLAGISDIQADWIMNTELECEHEVLIPRKKMVEILRYAKEIGKKVTLISDMYLPETIMRNLLSDIGIVDFERLMVSCDYGCGKGSGLFALYLDIIGDIRCLHIGDNVGADIQMPLKYGIDSYDIKSAYDMFKIFDRKKSLESIDDKKEKEMLGLRISELFNNPFVLHDAEKNREYQSVMEAQEKVV